MQNKLNKRVILSSTSTVQFGPPTPIGFTQKKLLGTELLPYFWIDLGQSYFVSVYGSPNMVDSKKLHTTSHSIVYTGLGVGINFCNKLCPGITWVYNVDLWL